MSFKEKLRAVSRQSTLLPISNRTLYHPSVHPLYMISGFEHQQSNNQTGYPVLTPAELFYTDPTLGCGGRIPNLVSELEVLDCFQLNTPQPRMSACQAPPARPDPFRSRPHPITDLGGLTLQISSPHPSLQQSLFVLQLTQEEDDTVTNLLKLHYQEPAALKPLLLSDEGRCWSESELEAANTLLNGFSLMEDDEMWGENEQKSDLPVGSKTVPGFNTPGCDQSGASSRGVEEDGGCGDFLSQSRSSVSKDLLSDSEGDAVNVLLSLSDLPVLQ
ncbi:uncharacterized protein LOC141784511 [Halichoeres trimaculatus]|uniref:uncharacterized protein LOC141784511 n=1 Tax=Halichoeres trimaculatus TaxID=147232 RepID=UPI003D9DDA7A